MHLSIESLSLAIDRSGRLFDTVEVVRWHQTTFVIFFPSRAVAFSYQEIDRNQLDLFDYTEIACLYVYLRCFLLGVVIGI